jgi:hypothetical protein
MEDYDYSTVSLDRYWSYVGIPYFLFIIGFGLFVLFKVTGTGTSAGPFQIKAVIADILGRPVGTGAASGATAGKGVVPVALPKPPSKPAGNGMANLLGIDPSLPRPPP